jgi:hypothetical protein
MADAFASDLFKKPPAEVLRYFDAKGVKPSFDHRDFSIEEHAHAFTVAKSTGYDILGDIKGALSKAIHERQDFEDFRKELEPILRAKGWWGKKVERDPLTGKEKEVQLGSVHRLKTIYWANVNTAYAAGEWERIQRTKRVLPFLRYLISTAVHKRMEHLAWVGTILPVDDEWWDSHYPPSAWRCQCRVEQLSHDEAIEAGYDPDNPEEPESFGVQDYVNKRTGEVSRVPVGVDPGWNSNPGKTRMQTAADFLTGKLDAMDENMRRIAVEDLAGSWLMKRIQSGEIPYEPSSRDPANVQRGQIEAPIAVLPAALAEAIEAKSQVVRFSVATATKQLRQEKGRMHFTPKDYEKVQRLIDRGEALIQKDGRDLLFQGVVDGETWLVVVRRAQTKPGEVRLTTLHRTNAKDMANNRLRGEVIREGQE